ncbi:rod shape-determining protein [bacterium CG2_30_37_16]|nr:MAG: rod shape-determining protein [bacterium CG2_30_37_16]PIP31140.1 MAG: rod shape-determining protein [bacterium (Candidatus Howlettbacteria) CG23_combo_of_CG06-09_8_20_14_all_37_9]PIX99800.1 MAG: rod shape-determining protein [bacterium (Candidatus Howlettbacteria) CG_4_10_14_3_um_filter_37_10]PJB05464.1 MAG: rod shape-determining protein [bacterium (Candidatus Howlettbacteria) CG_4_9_14_3_um_filter_37_10]
MLIKRIGIDLGTANVLVYLPKKGIVINEPSVVAISDDQKILAVGVEAKQMVGKTPDSIKAYKPLRDGVIADYMVTEAMIRYFINKVSGNIRIFRPEIMVSVPAGVTSTEKRAVIDATKQAGAREAFIIPEPVAAAIGAGIPIDSAAGNMVIDIGGGTTEVAVISLGGIVAANSVRVGGNRIDQSISDFIRKKYGLAIGDRTAEEIKIGIGSAIHEKKNKEMEIRGRDMIAGLPKTVAVSSHEITEAMRDELDKIILAVRAVLEQTPPELASDVIDRGMVMTGGGSLLKNIDKLITTATGIPCIVADDALLCVAKGIGIALDNLDDYKRSILSK